MKRIDATLQVAECALLHQTFDWKADVSLKSDLIFRPGRRLESIVHVRAADAPHSRGGRTRHGNKRSLPSSPEGSGPSSPTNPLRTPAAAAVADIVQHNKKPRCSSSVSSVDGQGMNGICVCVVCV